MCWQKTKCAICAVGFFSTIIFGSPLAGNVQAYLTEPSVRRIWHGHAVLGIVTFTNCSLFSNSISNDKLFNSIVSVGSTTS